jgi:uncharacterized C2H2 Zn-finger protein
MAEKKGIVEVVDEEREKRAQGATLENFIQIQADEEVTLRFMDEPEGEEDDKRVATTVAIHEYGEGKSYEPILCEGQGCKYCADGNRRKNIALFRAFVYEDKEVKVFARSTRSDMIIDLVKDYKRHGNITGADYVFEREGEGMQDTRYRLIRQADSTFKKPKTAKRTWITAKKLRQLVEQRYAPRGVSTSDGKRKGKRNEEEDEEDE